LKQYFKLPEVESGKKRKIHNANYMMDKLDRKYGGTSAMAMRLNNMSSLGPEASPVHNGNRKLLLNQMSEIQSL
jgi:hypothetical protein